MEINESKNNNSMTRDELPLKIFVINGRQQETWHIECATLN